MQFSLMVSSLFCSFIYTVVLSAVVSIFLAFKSIIDHMELSETNITELFLTRFDE